MKSFLTLILLCFTLVSVTHAAVIVPDRGDETQNVILQQDLAQQVAATTVQNDVVIYGNTAINKQRVVSETTIFNHSQDVTAVAMKYPDRALINYSNYRLQAAHTSLERCRTHIAFNKNNTRQSLTFKQVSSNLIVPLRS